VCHLASGDLWAGAEVQIAALLEALRRYADLELSAVVLNRGRLAEELECKGIPITVLDESRRGLGSILWSLRRHLVETRPDVLHSHRYKEHVLGACAAMLSHHPAVIQTFHGLEERLRGWAACKMVAYSNLTTICGRFMAKGFVGVSREIADVLRRRFPQGDVRCIKNGIDLTHVTSRVAHSETRASLGLPDEAFVIGTVCRLTPVKGVEFLLKAFTQVKKRSASKMWKLVVVGDGPLRQSLEALASDLGVASETIFLGARTDVFDVMAALDALTLPSLHEGIPVVLLEAMALGVPIVASQVGGIPEILADYKEARLVPSQNPNLLADAIVELAEDAELRRRLSSAARVRVESELSIATTAAQTRQFYWDLSKGRAH